MSIKLEEPVLDELTKSTNFFNGRLLTAADLKTDQQANRQGRRRLGRAVGEGVAHGLEVTQVTASPGKAPVLEVSPGLAVNRSGQTLALTSKARVELARQVSEAPLDAGLFAECGAAQTTTNLAHGVYLFVVGPASGFTGSAPMHGLAAGSKVTGCGSGSTVEGVQFRMAKLDLAALSAELTDSTVIDDIEDVFELTDTASLSRLRNLLAHLCFGTEQLRAASLDPFRQSEKGVSHVATYGAADYMRATGAMTDCEVPLALVLWRGSSPTFVDMWSVRRRVTRGSASRRWPSFLDDRRAAEGEAVFYQFQEQLESLVLELGEAAEEVVGSEYFRFLPPAGLLPLQGNNFNGFVYQKFFQYFGPAYTITIDGALLRRMLAEARDYEPIDLVSDTVARSPFIWKYVVWNNAQSETVQPFILFTHPYVYPPFYYFNFDQSEQTALVEEAAPEEPTGGGAGSGKYDFGKYDFGIKPGKLNLAESVGKFDFGANLGKQQQNLGKKPGFGKKATREAAPPRPEEPEPPQAEQPAEVESAGPQQPQDEPAPSPAPREAAARPNVTSAANLDNPGSGGGTGSLLETTRRALVRGENFAPDPAQNEVRFRLTKGPKEVVYRATAEAPPEGAGGGALAVVVPDIEEINLGFTAEVVLEVGAPGADEPGAGGLSVKVRRLRPAQ